MMSKWLALATMSLAIALGLTACDKGAAPPSAVHIFAAHDSPVTVEGGSIEANATKGNGWTPPGCQSTCTATSNNIGQILTDQVDGLAPTMQPLNGWIIEITNRHKDKTEKFGAITICSDQGCTGRNLDVNGKIYMKTRTDSRWTPRNGKLWFQDSECDGDSDDGAACNSFKKVTIKHKKLLFGWDKWTGTCGKGSTEGKCTIGIGTP